MRAWFDMHIVQKTIFLLKNHLGTWRKNHIVTTTAKFYSALIHLKITKVCTIYISLREIMGAQSNVSLSLWGRWILPILLQTNRVQANWEGVHISYKHTIMSGWNSILFEPPIGMSLLLSELCSSKNFHSRKFAAVNYILRNFTAEKFHLWYSLLQGLCQRPIFFRYDYCR